MNKYSNTLKRLALIRSLLHSTAWHLYASRNSGSVMLLSYWLCPSLCDAFVMVVMVVVMAMAMTTMAAVVAIQEVALLGQSKAMMVCDSV